MNTELINGALTMVGDEIYIHHNGATTEISSDTCNSINGVGNTNTLQIGDTSLTEEDVKDILKIIKVIKKREGFKHLFI